MAFIQNVRNLAKIAGRNDPAVRRILDRAERFPESIGCAEKLLRSICMKKGIDISDPPLFEIPENLPANGSFMGGVIRGNFPAGDYHLPESELEGNVGVFGTTGSGKSMLVRYLCGNWIEDDLGVIIFDQSNEYTSLIRRFCPARLRVFRGREFPIGPFVNPGGSCLSDIAYLSGVASVFRETMYLRDGSHNLLLKTAGDMYRDQGVLSGSGKYPSLTEVFGKLVSSKFSTQSRHAGYLETLVNRSHWVLQSFPWFNARKSPDPAGLFTGSTIILMGDMSPEEQDFFISMFLFWLNTALFRSIRQGIKIVCVIEEAHRIISSQKLTRYDMGEPLIMGQLRTCRKFGMSMVIIDQVPSELPAAVFGNLGMKVAFRLTDPPCISEISYSMGLDRDQKRRLGELPRRRALVQTAGNPEPFLLEVPELPENVLSSPGEIEERIKVSLESLDYSLEEIDVGVFLYGGRKKEEDKPDRGTIGGDRLMVFARISKAPYELIEERIEALGFDRAQEYRARQELVKLGMIEKGGVLGAKFIAYRPTLKGIEWAQNAGFEVYRYKGSLVHEIMVKKVKSALEGFSPDISVISEGEALGGTGIQPDMIVMAGGSGGDTSRRIAVQISYENKPGYEAQRAAGLSAIGQIDLVVIVAKNKKSCAAIENAVLKLGQGSLFGSAAHQAAGIRIIDFDSCIRPGYEWNWIKG